MSKKCYIMLLSIFLTITFFITTVISYCCDKESLCFDVSVSIFTGVIVLFATSLVDFLYERKAMKRAFILQYNIFIDEFSEFIKNNSFDRKWFVRHLSNLSFSIIELSSVSRKQSKIAASIKDILFQSIDNLQQSNNLVDTFQQLKDNHLNDLIDDLVKS